MAAAHNSGAAVAVQASGECARLVLHCCIWHWLANPWCMRAAGSRQLRLHTPAAAARLSLARCDWQPNAAPADASPMRSTCMCLLHTTHRMRLPRLGSQSGPTGGALAMLSERGVQDCQHVPGWHKRSTVLGMQP